MNKKVIVIGIIVIVIIIGIVLFSNGKDNTGEEFKKIMDNHFAEIEKENKNIEDSNNIDPLYNGTVYIETIDIRPIEEIEEFEKER